MNNDYIYISKIIHDTITDGVGFRTSVYCTGCNFYCNSCHNKELWDMSSGIKTKVDDIFDELIKNEVTNCTWIGGEPMLQTKGFIKLSKRIKEEAGKTIWIYSGFTFEEILQDKDKLELLKLCDVLVDGRFEIDKKDLTLKFRGSSNQNIINVQESLKQDKKIIYEV